MKVCSSSARFSGPQHARVQAPPRGAPSKLIGARCPVIAAAIGTRVQPDTMRQLIHSIPAGFQVPSTALAAVSTAILLGASYASRSQLVLLVAAVLAVVGYQLKQQLQQSPAIDAIASLQESTKGGSLQIQFAPEAARVKEVATETASAVHTEVPLALTKQMTYTPDQRATDAICLARALEHTNHVKALEIRSLRSQVVHLQLRIEKLRKDPSAFDVPSDPCEERLAADIVRSQVVHSLEVQLSNAQHENVQLRAQLQKQQALLEKHGLHLV